MNLPTLCNFWTKKFPRLALTKRKYWLLAGGFIVVLAGLGLVAWLSMSERSAEHSDNIRYVNIYFLHTNTHTLRAETGPLLLNAGSRHEQIADIIAHLQTPRSGALASTWDSVNDEVFTGFNLLANENGNENTVILNFSQDFLEIPAHKRTILISATTLSLTSLPFVQTVEITVENHGRIASKTAADIANNPLINPTAIASMPFTLFFINESGENLIPVPRIVTDFDIHTPELALVRQLIIGPGGIVLPDDEGSFSVTLPEIIPPSTEVLRLNVDEQSKTAHINLSANFHTRFTPFPGNPGLPRLMVQSIVNSLIYNFDDISRVYFLINGEILENFHGVAGFHRGFEWYKGEIEEIVDGY